MPLLSTGDTVDHSTTSLVLAVLALTIGAILAALVAAAAGFFAHRDGRSVPSAMTSAGTAFGGTYTIVLALMAVVAQWLK
ncbi:hypothetical protein [Streptomyces sp. NPDC002889]|uniref:hypothetical protein n=1 Tax=Streptomyces sp. NPDC002889 TaxID=3364669 RepID=UPI0036C37965